MVLQLEEDQDEGDASIPKIHLNLIKIAGIESVDPGHMVDIMGVVESCHDVASITRRDGTEAKKRDLTLRDDSNASIDVTLWGDKAEVSGTEIFNAVRNGHHPIVVLKSAPP
jgi:replication factor A1